MLALEDQKRGNHVEAIQLYQNALKEMSDPFERAKAYQNIGFSYSAMGNSFEASQYFRKAAKLRSQQESL